MGTTEAVRSFSFEKRRKKERDLRVHKQVQVVTKIVMKSVCRTWATIGSCHTRV